MDRRGEEDRQALVRIVAVLLALAMAAEAAGTLPARNRIVVLAALRHAAAVACAFAAHIHAPHFHVPVDSRRWPAPASGEVEAARFAAIFQALAVALAVPARQAMRAARWVAHRTSGLPGEYPAAGFVPHRYLAAKPCFADTS